MDEIDGDVIVGAIQVVLMILILVFVLWSTA